jgi:tRNA(Arg) A34 adenosine deaminase TadA
VLVQVPGKPARSKAQYRRDQLIWPCLYLFQQPVPALTPGEERVARAHLEDAESEARRAEASGWPPVAAVIVDPTANRVVARAHSRTLRATADAGPCHVLHTAVMACIQAVAEAHLAAATAPGYDLATAPYLCTGLDLYTNLEPDAMYAKHPVRVFWLSCQDRALCPLPQGCHGHGSLSNAEGDLQRGQ